MIKYRLKLGVETYVGGMPYGGRYGRTKNQSLAIVFSGRAEADAAAIQYGAWVEEFELNPLPSAFPKGS